MERRFAIPSDCGGVMGTCVREHGRVGECLENHLAKDFCFFFCSAVRFNPCVFYVHSL